MISKGTKKKTLVTILVLAVIVGLVAIGRFRLGFATTESRTNNSNLQFPESSASREQTTSQPELRVTVTDSLTCEVAAAKIYTVGSPSESVSFCQQLQGFIATLQTNISTGNREAVADMVNFPALEDSGESDGYVNRDQFLRDYDSIMDSDMKEQIVEATAGNAFITGNGISIANGLWIEADPSLQNANWTFHIISI